MFKNHKMDKYMHMLVWSLCAMITTHSHAVFGQSTSRSDWNTYTQNWNTQLNGLDTLIRALTIIMPTLVFFFFVWGCVKYVKSGGKDGAQGLKVIGWSLIGFFVMVSLWGIIGFFGGVVGIKGGEGVTYQKIRLPDPKLLK